MPIGTVLSFDDITGSGRIMGDDGTLVKVSNRSLMGDGYRILDEGQRVKFDLVRNKSGYEASAVVTETADTLF